MLITGPPAPTLGEAAWDSKLHVCCRAVWCTGLGATLLSCSFMSLNAVRACPAALLPAAASSPQHLHAAVLQVFIKTIGELLLLLQYSQCRHHSHLQT